MNIENKTKIIATIGPASDSVSKIEELILAGVDVFRFNTKHSTIEWHNKRIKRVQKIANKNKKNIGIMIDLQGSEIRIQTREGKDIMTKQNDIIFISNSFDNKETLIAIPNNKILQKLKIGNFISIDDGSVVLEVIKNEKDIIQVKVIEEGIIKNKKSLNFPGTDIKLSSLIKKDIDNLDATAKHNITFVALSFVTSKRDVQLLRAELQKRNMEALIVSKIENQQAINDIDEIIKESDAIMIARGDLGIEIPIESIVFWQKEIIKKCRQNRKPVIVATQMLHSMIENPRPTRAEVTDIANAVFNGTDAVMLSEETALGKYPVKSTLILDKILKFNEQKARFKNNQSSVLTPTEFMIGSIIKEIENNKNISEQLKIKTAIVFAETGYAARVISSFRTKIRIIAITNNQHTAKHLSLSYGIIPYYTPSKFDYIPILKKLKFFSTLRAFSTYLPKKIINDIKKKNLVSQNETIIVFHGQYKKRPNLSNLCFLMKVN